MFDFQRMGWDGFQRLCITVSRAVLGQTVEAFLDSNDAGMVGAFRGVWGPMPGITMYGRFVMQCKFSSRLGRRRSLADLESDIGRVPAVSLGGGCDAVLTMTNSGR